MLCNLEALGAGVGLESFGLILVLGDGIGLTAVLTVGEGFVPMFEGGGGGAGRRGGRRGSCRRQGGDGGGDEGGRSPKP